MGAPIIESVTPESASLAPGEFVDVTILATDPTWASGEVRFPVSDQQGNVTHATIQLTLEDDLVFGDAETELNVTVQLISSEEDRATYRITATE